MNSSTICTFHTCITAYSVCLVNISFIKLINTWLCTANFLIDNDCAIKKWKQPVWEFFILIGYSSLQMLLLKFSLCQCTSICKWTSMMSECSFNKISISVVLGGYKYLSDGDIDCFKLKNCNFRAEDKIMLTFLWW